ncbi:hypothetical protein OFO08_02060 [Campylobacter sp. JMF_10 EL2]|uniref:hypothetical protein n=1 Tax=Campylobacter sp. JMF_10 EL2 TaxID=2983828 RepID=UPI0022E9A0F4|nr:hypothetical protein [Campylobacter sp. JMF_10 EL2]MDA3073007.1 hypothetical protein [Campylobacter sp. JMF_10 EL2]
MFVRIIILDINNIVSYWKLDKKDCILFKDTEEDFYVIFGEYNHKNQKTKGEFCIGVCWENYPIQRDKLSPMVLSKETSNGLLDGLFIKAVKDKNQKLSDKILKITEKLK